MYLELAKKEAIKAETKGEVPVGAVIVCGNKVVASAGNRREGKKRATAHAEILAINKACRKLKSWRLDDCEMYVSLLPCPMCAGAIVAARIKQVFVGAVSNELQLIEQIFVNNNQNHKTALVQLRDSECELMLKNFFGRLRGSNNSKTID